MFLAGEEGELRERAARVGGPFCYARAALTKGVPIWMVYGKGPGHALNEKVIRDFLRGNGLMDTNGVCVEQADGVAVLKAEFSLNL